MFLGFHTTYLSLQMGFNEFIPDHCHGTTATWLPESLCFNPIDWQIFYHKVGLRCDQFLIIKIFAKYFPNFLRAILFLIMKGGGTGIPTIHYGVRGRSAVKGILGSEKGMVLFSLG